MREKQKLKEQGITLTVLVVTIIIMLILAGVTISLLNQAGILKNSESAANKYEITDEQDVISVAFSTVFANSALNDKDITPDMLQQELNKTTRDTIVTKSNDSDKQNLLFIKFNKTKNQHSVDITNGRIDYVGAYSEITVDLLKDTAITMTGNPTKWTNGNVTVTITYTLPEDKKGEKDKIVLEYATSKAANDWKSCTGTVVVEENMTVYARLRYLQETTEAASYNIDNIDKIPPTLALGTNGGTYIKSTEGSTTIRTSVTASDTGGSGIDPQSLKYVWSQSTTAPTTGWTSFTNGQTIQKADIRATGTWYLYTQYNDIARKNTGTEVIITKSNAFIISDSALAIEFIRWDGINAIMKITGNQIGSQLQYKIGTGAWNNITSGQTVSVRTGTTLYASLFDGINRKYISSTPILTYNVVWRANGGTGNNITDSNRNYDTTYQARPANTFSRAGYTFTNWKCNNVDYAAGANYSNLTTTNGATVYMDAQWKANTYTVSYNANGGTGTMPNDTATYDTKYVTKANGFSREGYTFIGWNEQADGRGTSWTDWIGKEWKWTYTKSITLYAQWQINQYEVICEDYFVDSSYGLRVKLGTQTAVKKDWGTTVSGSEWGTNVNYRNYIYIGSSTATVSTSGAKVYRYFKAWTDINIYSPAGSQDYKSGKFGCSYDSGTTWTDDLNNEPTGTNKKYSFYGEYVYVRNLVGYYDYYELDRVSGCTWDGNNNRWYYQVTEAGHIMDFYMKYKKYYLDLNVYCDGKNIGPNNWDGRVTVGFKINGVDQGYIRDYYQQVVYGTTWEIYGVKMDGYTRTYSASGTVTAATAANVTVGKMSFSSNNTSYGNVSASEYIVLSGTTYSTNNRTLTLSDGRSVTASVSDVTGHTTSFTGWSPSSGMVNNSVGIVANFSRSVNKYTFTLGSATGISTTGSSGTGQYAYGSTITLKASANVGYAFNKWSSSNTSLVADLSSNDTSFTMPAGNITMTPSVSRVYSVIFDANGGEYSGMSEYVKVGSTFTIDFSTSPTWAEHIFLGWDTSSTATKPTYKSNGTKTFTMPSNDVTLYAIWHIHTGDSINGGGCYTGTKTHTHIGDETNGGACYKRHTHKGNTTSGGACYKSNGTKECGRTLSWQTIESGGAAGQSKGSCSVHGTRTVEATAKPGMTCTEQVTTYKLNCSKQYELNCTRSTEYYLNCEYKDY